MVRRLICIGIGLFLYIPIQAATYHVKKTGNDTTGDGSSGTPWLTINKCSDNVSSSGGDTCIIYVGTYSENARLKGSVSGPNTIYRVNSGDVVTINGTNPQAPVLFSEFETANNITFDGFYIKDASGTNSGIAILNHSSITIQNVTVSSNNYCGLIVSGSTNTVIQDSTFFDNGAYVANDAGNSCAGIYSATGNYNTIIRDNNIYHNGGMGISLYGPSPGGAIGTGPESPSSGGMSQYSYVQNNIVSSNAVSGIWVARSYRSLIEGNTVYGNMSTGIQAEIGARWVAVKNNVFYNQARASNYEIGIWMDETVWGLVEGNQVYRNPKGLGITQSHRIITKNNSFYNNKGQAAPGAGTCCDLAGAIQTLGGGVGGGTTPGATNNVYVHNTFYDNGFSTNPAGGGIIGTDGHDGQGNGIGAQWNNSNYNNVFKNNITSRAQGINHYVWWFEQFDDFEQAASNYNIWHSTGTPAWYVAGTTFTFTQYKSSSSRDLNSVLTDPGMTDPSGGNFVLLSTSVAIDSGTWLTVTVGTGSVTSLPVSDVRYFHDGFGVTTGSLIQLQGMTTNVYVIALSTVTNVLTISSSTTWTNALGVAYPYSGSLPDKGSFEFVSTSSGAPIITPSTATVYVGGNTIQFSSTDTVTWSLVSGSTGTISAGGLYTSPTSIQAKQVMDGCPVLPNDHVYNTMIDALPVHSSSTARIATILGGTTGYIQFEVSFPHNVMSSNTLTVSNTFYYTPTNNGLYPMHSFPYRGVESSALPDAYFARDHHILGVSTTTCQFVEMYNSYPVGANPDCAACTSQSGIKYLGTSYDLPTIGTGGSTDAAGLYVQPLALRYSELLGNQEINHALRFTLANAYIYPGYVWPGTANATPSCGSAASCLPYGARLRLKSSVSTTGYSATTQKILRALKTYGMFLADGGTSMRLQSMNDLMTDATTYAAIQTEIRFGDIVGQFQFEQVDESSLMVSASSGMVKINNPYVVPSNYAEVVATKNLDGSSATVRIAIQPVTVGTYNPPFQANAGALSVMAGTPQFQIPYWVKGATTTTVSCTMSPSTGTLTSGCLYTAPSTLINTLTTTTITITPTADSTGTITLPLTIFPSDGIRINAGGLSAASAPDIPNVGINYGPDASPTASMWWTDPPGSGLGWSTKQDSVYQQALWVGSNTISDIGRYYTYWPGGSDGAYSAMVPNGNYRLTLGFAEGDPGSGSISNVIQSVDTQGSTIISTTTMRGITGLVNYVSTNTVVNVSVTDNKFYFALRDVTDSSGTIINFWSLITSTAVVASGVPPNLSGNARFSGRGTVRF